MPNRYRRPLVLLTFRTGSPPGRWVARWVGTEHIHEWPNGTLTVRFTLIGLSAN